MDKRKQSFTDVIPDEDVYIRDFSDHSGMFIDNRGMLFHALEVRGRALSAAKELDKKVGFVALQE